MTAADDLGVHRFDRRFFGSEHQFTRIGSGALGGKGSGLRTIRERILTRLEPDELPFVTVDVPRLVVLTTEVFETFMQRNRLDPHELASQPDSRIAHVFQRGEIPAEHVGDLRGLIAAVRTPLAVRSSSLLEDALAHPFAGVYATKMIPNHELDEDARFRRFAGAIKFVWASTYFAEAVSSRRSAGQPIDSERMAVIVQEIVGERHGNRFYPTLSGVARSYNHYPASGGRPQEGVVSLALGLGKTIVDGGHTWTYSPARPTAPPPFNTIGDLLKFTQNSFWAVNMGEPPPPDPVRETECLVRAGLKDAEADGTLKYLASSYDPESDRLQSGVSARGPRALTFAPLLGSRVLPFTRAVDRLVQLAREELGAEVEIELAATLDPDGGLPMRIGFLQVRPMLGAGDRHPVEVEELSGPDVVVASEHSLGNGLRDDLVDVVYLRPTAWDPGMTRAMAAELEAVNRGLVDEGRQAVLIGFGRWGTSDERLGVPVVWGQISAARVIVEATMPGVQPELSQGSHFFHNVLAFRVLYLAVEHTGPHPIDWTWLEQQPAVWESRFVRHVRLQSPLEVRVDGTTQRGLVRRERRR